MPSERNVEMSCPEELRSRRRRGAILRSDKGKDSASSFGWKEQGTSIIQIDLGSAENDNIAFLGILTLNGKKCRASRDGFHRTALYRRRPTYLPTYLPIRRVNGILFNFISRERKRPRGIDTSSRAGATSLCKRPRLETALVPANVTLFAKCAFSWRVEALNSAYNHIF